MGNVLNLAGADMSAGDFDPVMSGTYPATIGKFETKYSKGGEDAKLPGGTQMFSVGFVLNEDAVDLDGNSVAGRWVWTNLIVAPVKGVDGKPYDKKKFLDGILANFIVACGFSEEEVTSGEFELDEENMKGTEMAIKVVKKMNDHTKEMGNQINAFKPIGELEAASGAGIV